MEKDNKIDIFSPAVIMAFIAAFLGDFTFSLIITHYFFGIFALAVFFPKSRGWMAKIALVLAFLLPLPTLMIGIFLAILLSNKVIAFLAEQAAIQVVAVATAGAGEALEAGALAEAGVAASEATAAATEAAAAEAAAAETTATEAAAETRETTSAAKRTKEAYDQITGLNDAFNEEKQQNQKEDEKEYDPAITGEEQELLGEKGELQEKFFEEPTQIPTDINSAEDETEINTVQPTGERERQQRKIEEIRKRQEKLAPLQQISARDESKDEKAA